MAAVTLQFCGTARVGRIAARAGVDLEDAAGVVAADGKRGGRALNGHVLAEEQFAAGQGDGERPVAGL